MEEQEANESGTKNIIITGKSSKVKVSQETLKKMEFYMQLRLVINTLSMIIKIIVGIVALISICYMTYKYGGSAGYCTVVFFYICKKFSENLPL